MRYRFLLAIALAPVLGAAMAQPAPVAMPAIPAHNCVAPEYPGKLASDTRMKAFNREYKAYGDCIKQYVESTKTLVNVTVEAGNKAIDEYNKYAEDLKAKVDANK